MPAVLPAAGTPASLPPLPVPGACPSFRVPAHPVLPALGGSGSVPAPSSQPVAAELGSRSLVPQRSAAGIDWRVVLAAGVVIAVVIAAFGLGISTGRKSGAVGRSVVPSRVEALPAVEVATGATDLEPHVVPADRALIAAPEPAAGDPVDAAAGGSDVTRDPKRSKKTARTSSGAGAPPSTALPTRSSSAPARPAPSIIRQTPF